MDSGTIGLIILFGTALVASFLLHRYLRSFWRASFTASLLASVTLITADTISRGYPDKRAALALILGFIVSFLVSLPVGWITRRYFGRAPRE